MLIITKLYYVSFNYKSVSFSIQTRHLQKCIIFHAITCDNLIDWLNPRQFPAISLVQRFPISGFHDHEWFPVNEHKRSDSIWDHYDIM